MMWNLCSYPTKVLNERMWHFNGSKHTLTALLHIFRGGQDSQPPEFTPPVCRIRLCSFYMRTLSTNVGGRLCWLMSDSGLKWKKTSLLVLGSVVVYLTLSKSKTIEWVSEQGLTSSQRISETSIYGQSLALVYWQPIENTSKQKILKQHNQRGSSEQQVAVSFKIIMTTSVTRSCFTKQHQNCKTKTKRPQVARPRPTFWSQTGLVLRPTVSDHITGSGEGTRLPFQKVGTADAQRRI